MFRRDVKTLAEILAQCLRHDGLETPLMQKRVIDAWDKVVGKAVARYTGDKYIKNQTLYVKITSPALRADLTMMRERLVKSLNNEVGTMIITDIKLY